MDHLDLLVLRTLRDWRAANRRALLVTVVHTWGSSPRPVGAIMALADDGTVAGSVSGGCVEDDLIARFAGADATERPVLPLLVRYGVTADEAHRFGLPCGGRLELLVEPDPRAATLCDLVERLEAGRLVRRTLRIADGMDLIAPAAAPDDLRLADGFLHATFGPGWRMLLTGAGQLSQSLATMALFNGFAVTVCDPREEYRTGFAVPGARLEHGMPDDVLADFRPDCRSAVLALTHDPKLDDLMLIDALRSEAMYIGAIGSRRNHAGKRQRLREHFGLTDAELGRLHGPVGIYIGSKTPAEIAVSIMAEVLAVKNGVDLGRFASVAQAKDMLGAAPSAALCHAAG
ncbi:XdhC family protein [Xylophilus sp.]|uniref:XdhC family protein n=1 Tax=Xylophilus sp. TaxID=2653893 RepID=UPI0013B8D655|nr:XdhC family protein [Xylophilus sp.]KAF1048756.1 MAG: putative xanthine dehydrogenase subunit A [Xylophilus sp.]